MYDYTVGILKEHDEQRFRARLSTFPPTCPPTR